jgi:hypothetical protein
MESRALDSNATTLEDLALLQFVDVAVMEYSEELGRVPYPRVILSFVDDALILAAIR